MSESEGFTVRTMLMRPAERTALLRAAVAAVAADTAALRSGIPGPATPGWDDGVAAAVEALDAAAERDTSDPEVPRTRLIAQPSAALIDAVSTVAPVALHATLWDAEANLLLDVINGDRFWIRVTAEEIEDLVEGVADVRVEPDGDWVPGTNSRAKRAWGRRTKSRFQG